MEKKKEVLLQTVDLKKYYKINSKKLFDPSQYLKAVGGIDLEVYKGEVLGIVGESGCGKSTLGNMIANLLEPTSGLVEFEGQSFKTLQKKDRKKLRREIQIIFQDPYSSLNPKKKIGWLLEESLLIHKVGNKRERLQMAADMLKAVGLDESYMGKYPRELSGGQRQRVNIAIALILRPKFIVADEAVSALDVSIQAQVLNLLKQLQAEFDLTYVFITHDLDVVQYISDRIAVMYLGKIVEIGQVDLVYHTPAHPYTKALLSAAPTTGTIKRERIILTGDVPSPIRIPEGCPFHTRCPEVRETCRNQAPELLEKSDGRKVACHFFQ